MEDKTIEQQPKAEPQQQQQQPQQHQQQQDPMIGKVFFNKYTLQKKLGEGSFGSIYYATSQDESFALKFENKTKGQGLLESEAYIMSYLKGPGIPFVKSYGYSQDHNILVMELLGKSLEDIFIALPPKKMTVKCVCNIGYQMVNILQYVHDKHIIHRDIKPDNFVVGLGDKANLIYLLDFGLAKKFRSSTTLKHYPMMNKKKLTGTARYASINALNGFEQSRRDDLEAVGYVLMYFLRGALPWQGLPVKNKEDRYLKIMEKKRDTTPRELCDGYPKEFESYINYTRNLDYEQDPDYDYLKNLFIQILKQSNQSIDYIYDWPSSEPKIQAKEKDSLKNNIGSVNLTHNNDSDHLNGPQITVVNNYYHNIQNIVIQSNEKDNKEQENKKKLMPNNDNKENKMPLNEQQTNVNQSKEANNNLNTNSQSNSNKKNYHNNLQPNKEVNDFQNLNIKKKELLMSNINIDEGKIPIYEELNQKIPVVATSSNLNSNLNANNNNQNNQNTNANVNNGNIKRDPSNIIITKKEKDNKCCIII